MLVLPDSTASEARMVNVVYTRAIFAVPFDPITSCRAE
jgi:hypothetical protein